MPLLLTLPFADTSPVFGGDPLHAGAGSAVLGRATIGARSWLGSASVIRADGHTVTIGDDFHLAARATVHITHDLYPTVIGSGVTVAENAIVHACTVHDGCHIGRDAIILDACVIGGGAALADGSIVFPKTELEGGWLYEGAPAKPVRRLEAAEMEALHTATRSADDAPLTATGAKPAMIEAGDGLFVAATASVSGRLFAGFGLGVWFSTRLDAGNHAIRVGDSTNIQDNSLLVARDRDITIGSRITIGHNVSATDVTIGDDTLIGMGSILAPGTVVGDNVLVAAGSRTTPGQVLEAGRFHSGSPAVDRGPIDDRKRMIVAGAWRHYLGYGVEFNRRQADAGLSR
jgi:carbonic anhydrase/acetyltransferase-like protein (isoleucine patch superfamily)